MSRSEFTAQLNPRFSVKDIEAMVATISDTMADALAERDQVELRDLGSFAFEFAARSAHNLRMEASVALVARKHIAFKTGKTMRTWRDPMAAGSRCEADQLSRAS